MAKKDNNFEHRGRYQAQGEGVEESEPWAEKNPLTISKALQLLKNLIQKLSTGDYEKRRREFEKAENFIKEASENGGVFARLRKSFRVKGSKNERVDIEVLGGKAFVKDSEKD